MKRPLRLRYTIKAFIIFALSIINFTQLNAQDTILIDSTITIDRGPWYDTHSIKIIAPAPWLYNRILYCHEIQQFELDENLDTIWNEDVIITNQLNDSIKESTDAFNNSGIITINKKLIGNILSGPFSINYSVKYNNGVGDDSIYRYSLSGTYKDGVPDGNWRIVISTESANNITEKNNEEYQQVSFENGRPIQISNSNYRLNLVGSNISTGTINIDSSTKYVIRNNIVTNYYYRRDDELIRIDDWETKNIIDTIAKNGFPQYSELVDNGYTSEYLDIWPLDRFYELLGENYANLSHFDQKDLDADNVIRYYILKRINIFGSHSEAEEYYMAHQSEYERIKECRCFGDSDNILYLNSNDYEFWLEFSKKHPYEPLNKEKWLSNEVSMVDSLLSQLVLLTSNKKVGKVSFKRKDEKLLSYINGEFQKSGDIKIINQRLAPYCPMVGYSILQIDQIGETDSAEIAYTFNVSCGKDQGYETYRSALIIHGGKVNITSFDFSKAQRIRNDWDSIKVLRSIIVNNTHNIDSLSRKSFSDVNKVYQKQLSNTNLEISNNLKESISRLNNFISIQKKYLTILSYRYRIHKQNTEIKNNTQKDIKDVKKEYSNYFKNCDLTVHDDIESSMKRLLFQIQIQDTCIAFINLRQTIYKNHLSILHSGKKYKRILKIYKRYYKASNRNWQPSIDVTNQLYTILNKQHQLLIAIQNIQLIDIDKQVRKNKNGNIDLILDLISQN